MNHFDEMSGAFQAMAHKTDEHLEQFNKISLGRDDSRGKK